MKLKLCYCPHADCSVPLPQKQTTGAAGYDVYANLHIEQRFCGIEIAVGEFLAVSTGFCLAGPSDLLCEVRSRSGLARLYGIVVLNSPGTIDPDYRGEIAIILMNHGKESFIVSHGMRIAQLIFTKFESPEIIQVDDLDSSDRGGNGFGSTGLY